MPNADKPQSMKETDLKQVCAQNQNSSRHERTCENNSIVTDGTLPQFYNKENFRGGFNSSRAYWPNSSSKETECGTVTESTKKSSKRSLPVEDEGSSEKQIKPLHRLNLKKPANPDRNSKLLQRFSFFTEEDFEDFDDDLKASCEKTTKTTNEDSLNSKKQNPQNKQSFSEENFNILELFNQNNMGEHPSHLQPALQSTDTENNLSQCSSTGGTQCFYNFSQPKKALDNDKDSQNISEMCNAKKFLSAVDESQKLIPNAGCSLKNNDARTNFSTKKLSNERGIVELNAPQLGKNSRESFQNHLTTLGASVCLSKGNTVCTQVAPNPEVVRPGFSPHSANLFHVRGSTPRDAMRLPVQKASAGNKTKQSSEVCAQFTVTSNTIKPKFPGPAGLLPNLESLEGADLTLASRMLSAIQDSGTKKPSGKEPLPALALSPLWSSMLQDLDIDPSSANSPLRRHNIERSVLRQHGSCSSAVGSGGLRRVPMLVVQVNAVQPAHSQATLQLSDHTGEVSGLLSASGVGMYLTSLTAGCVLLLTSVTVWHRAPARPPLLTITADNIAAVYSPVRRLPPTVGQADRATALSGDGASSDVLDVKITSGLTAEERRRLKDKIGIDAILERSLVEEDFDFKANAVKRIECDAPNVNKRSFLNDLNSSRVSAGAHSSFRPHAPVGSSTRAPPASWNSPHNSSAPRPRGSSGTVSANFKPTPLLPPRESTVTNSATADKVTRVPNTNAGTVKSGCSNGSLAKPTLLNTPTRFSLRAFKTPDGTSNASSLAGNDKNITPVRAGAGPRFRFSPIVPGALDDIGSGQRMSSNSGQGTMSTQSTFTHTSTSTPHCKAVSSAKFSITSSNVPTSSSTPNRSSYCVSVNKAKQFSHKSGAPINSCTTKQDSDFVSQSNQIQGGETSKSALAEAARSRSGQTEMSSSLSGGAEAPTERELREIQELMATFTENDFDDF